MSGSTSKGEWKEPWHNGNMHNIEDFPSLLRLYPTTILLLFFFTYSYIRPSTYNWNIKSSCHSLSPFCLAIGCCPPLLPPS